MKSIPNVDVNNLVKLKKLGFNSVDLCSPYEVLRLVQLEPYKVTLILFTSKKLLIQTKKDVESKVMQLLKSQGIDIPSNLKTTKEETKQKLVSRSGVFIGSDECLKGDTFGGIVVAALKANESQRKQLLDWGVMDSKKVTNEKILEIAPRIMATMEYAVENLYPNDYNKFKVTPLLNRLHRDVATQLKLQSKNQNDIKHVVDKYPGCIVGDIIIERAESKYIEVAAASIIARYYALKQIEELSKRAGFDIPKGSTHVKTALKKLKKLSTQDNDKYNPDNFVKTGFSNVQDILKE